MVHRSPAFCCADPSLHGGYPLKVVVGVGLEEKLASPTVGLRECLNVLVLSLAMEVVGVAGTTPQAPVMALLAVKISVAAVGLEVSL